jgi:CopG family nickel-responsive transcriptional regulator
MKFLLTIVSVSLNEDIIESMDKLKSLGFSGRSDIIRAGIRNLLSDERMKEDLDGEINSLLLAVHDEDSDDQVSSIRHDFDKIIIVHLHNKIDKDRCLEIFSLKGDARDIKAISTSDKQKNAFRKTNCGLNSDNHRGLLLTPSFKLPMYEILRQNMWIDYDRVYIWNIF